MGDARVGRVSPVYMRAIFACAAARSHERHGREVEYSSQPDRSSGGALLRRADRHALGVPGPFAELAHAARSVADGSPRRTTTAP